MRILVSGGGTAGHISPILATVDALKQLDKDAHILYVGQKGSMEARIARSAGLEFASIQAGKLRRYHNTKLYNKLTDLSTLALNLRDLGRFGVGITQSLKVLREFKPDVVFIKGGYVGLPVGLAAGILRRPYVVHESDIVPGMTNKILSKRAVAVATGFPVDKYRDLPADKLVFTGNPVREEILKAHRLEGIAKLRLNPDLPVVLVIGGSQGAKTVNDAVVAALPELTAKAQIIHIAGERDVERVRFEVGRLKLDHPERYQLFAFLLKEMGPVLAATDLAISRAGANAIAELAALKKPTIFIPGAHLVGGHQEANAQVLARAGAARVLPESKLSRASLGAEVNRLLDQPEEMQRLAEHFKAFARLDSAQKLAELILSSAAPVEVERSG